MHMGFNLAVFDLDDTLYAERDYVISGFRAVSNALFSGPIKQQTVFERFCELFLQDPKRVFDRFVADETAGDGLGEHFLAHAIEVYRDHIPDIRLFAEVDGVLGSLRAAGLRLAIITDGRSDGQKRKIGALGLEHKVDRVVYTDLLAPGRAYWKPHPFAFR